MKRSWMAVGMAVAMTIALAGCEKMKPAEEGATEPGAPAAEIAPAAEAGSVTAGTPATIAITKANGQTVQITVEIAKTDEQKAAGLMNREGLAENAGMWFDFSDRGMGDYAFWMKNTLIDLDWIFVDNQMKIVHIKANNAAKDETLYHAPKPFQYVLEIKAGEAERLGIKENDAVQVAIGPVS